MVTVCREEVASEWARSTTTFLFPSVNSSKLFQLCIPTHQFLLKAFHSCNVNLGPTKLSIKQLSTDKRLFYLPIKV